MNPEIEQLPQDIEAEKSVLGALLLDEPDTFPQVIELLPQNRLFFDLKHRLIFEAIQEQAAEQMPTDIISIRNRLQTLKRGKKIVDCVEDAGGMEYLMQLSRIDSPAQADHHAAIVREKARLREFILLTDTLSQRCKETTFTSIDAEKLMAKGFDRIREGSSNSGKLYTTAEAVPAIMAELHAQDAGKVPGITTGWSNLDGNTGGYFDDLVIIGGRPSMGKTAFALNLAINIAERDNPVGFFSAEMSMRQMIIRMLSNGSGCNSQAINSKALNEERWEAVQETAKRLEQLPIIFNFKTKLTMQTIENSARQMVTKHGAKAAFIDQLSFIKTEKADRYDLAIGMQSTALKQLAKELKLPVFLLVQLNRACDIRDDHRPRKSDAKNSGSLEEDSDEMIFLYRPQVYDEKADPRELEAICVKRRNGPVGTENFHFDQATGRITEANYYKGNQFAADNRQF